LLGVALGAQQLVDAVPQRVDVGHGAQGVHGWVVQAIDGRTHGHRAGGEQQGVVRQQVGAILGRDGHLAGPAVDAGDPVAGAHVQVQRRGQRRGGV